MHRQLQMEPEGSPLRKEHKIEAQVWAAQKDPASADALIGQYMPFIRSETFKFTHAAPEAGHEDELNIAATAFYEAALSYQRGRGAFLPYASTAIRNRLIDFYRVEQRHSGLVPLDTPVGEDGRPLLEALPDSRDEIGAYDLRAASREEIQEFGRQLATFGLSFSDVADNCPRQERTMAACHAVLNCARANPMLLDRLVHTGRLPVRELAMGSGVDKKTIERHRKYLVAILLAFTNGYEIIRGHLRQIAPKGGERT